MKLKYHDLGAREQFDRYDTFHKVYGVFTAFRTGELAIMDAAPDPSERKVWTVFNVALTATNDGTWQFLLNGDEVPKAWLDRCGQQYLFVDLDLKRAYRLKWAAGTNAKRLPAYLTSSAGRYFGAGQEPVYAPPIDVIMPDKVFTQRARQWVKELKAVAALTVRVHATEQERFRAQYSVMTYEVTEQMLDTSPAEFAAKFSPFELALRLHGTYSYERKTTYHDYLEVRKL